MLRIVPHVRQEYDWDCGLACVRMVLKRTLPSISEKNFESVCEELGFGTNVWTIDLASILTYFKMNYIFYTETFGVDVSYQNNSFYREAFEEDQARVKSLFSCAPDLGLKVEKRSISLEDICIQLKKGFVAIALINLNFLHCKWCRQTSRINQLRYLMYKFKQNCCSYEEEYAGHYIVVCGYNIGMNCFYFKNPSSDSDICSISFTEFEDAWHCYGTDSDIIFVDIEGTAVGCE